jgi:hypothetical protein
MPERIPGHQWENYEVRPEHARRGAARNLSGLHFPLLRSWQKRRFLPAETKLMSDKRARSAFGRPEVDPKGAVQGGTEAQKAPQATFSNELGSAGPAHSRERLVEILPRHHVLDVGGQFTPPVWILPVGARNVDRVDHPQKILDLQ